MMGRTRHGAKPVSFGKIVDTMLRKRKLSFLPMHMKYFTFFPNNFLQNKFKIYKIYFKVYTPQDFAAPLTEFVTV